MIDLSRHFGQFNLQARLFPALLMCSPILFIIGFLWPASPLVRLAPLVLAIGLLFFLADFVRGRGQTLQQKLIDKWGGLPTQTALWLTRTEDPVLTRDRRAMVEHLTGRKLPTKQLEQSNPTRTKQEYNAAIRELIPKVRGKESDDLLHQENIRYSFRRNALAIRPFALWIAGVCAAVALLAAVIGDQRSEALTALGISLLILAGWGLTARDSWVKQAADTYCERFYDALRGHVSRSQ